MSHNPNRAKHETEETDDPNDLLTFHYQSLPHNFIVSSCVFVIPNKRRMRKIHGCILIVKVGISDGVLWIAFISNQRVLLVA